LSDFTGGLLAFAFFSVVVVVVVVVFDESSSAAAIFPSASFALNPPRVGFKSAIGPEEDEEDATSLATTKLVPLSSFSFLRSAAAFAADFCPPKKTIVETMAAAPSRLARFCFSFSPSLLLLLSLLSSDEEED
jgi:hypothetical protein